MGKYQTVTIPSNVIKHYQDEVLEKIRSDLSNPNYQQDTNFAGGLLSNRSAAWNLDFIKACSTNDQTGGDALFTLIVRNRTIEDLQETAEAMVSIMQKQNFTVSEALLFLKHLESLVLASPVNY